MADPLSVAASIIGILAAATKVGEFLGPYIATSKNAPKLATTIYSEVTRIQVVLTSMKNMISTLSTPASSFARAKLIQVDQFIVLFTDGVLLFDELETMLEPLSLPDKDELSFRQRLQWASKKNSIIDVFNRLQRFQVTLSALLNIFQCESDLAAMESLRVLETEMLAMLTSNEALVAKVSHLESALLINESDDHVEGYEPSLITINALSLNRNVSIRDQSRHPSTSRAPPTLPQLFKGPGLDPDHFEHTLDASRVYRRARRTESLISFSTSALGTKAWSVFSGVSLAEISVLSAIALPLQREDVQNAYHYALDTSAADYDTVAKLQDFFERDCPLGALILSSRVAISVAAVEQPGLDKPRRRYEPPVYNVQTAYLFETGLVFHGPGPTCSGRIRLENINDILAPSRYSWSDVQIIYGQGSAAGKVRLQFLDDDQKYWIKAVRKQSTIRREAVGAGDVKHDDWVARYPLSMTASLLERLNKANYTG